MIKDTQQKLKAIRYCVALGFVPHMEVVVRYSGDTSDSPCDLTDIDVYGLKPGAAAQSLRVIFDCKTLNKMSPINRAFWAKGLMALTRCDEAFVILSKPAIEGHRLAGNSFGVRLFSEPLFDAFAAAASADFLLPNSYLEDLARWSALAEIGKKYSALADLLVFLTSTAPLQTTGTTGLRTLMSKVRHCSGELDPNKNVHRTVFKLALTQFTIFVNEMVRDFHNIFDPQVDRVQFERTLRYYVWGGKENYELRQRLNTALKAAKGVADAEPFEFPSWDKFVDYFRNCLDAPLALSAVCLPLKDMAFRELSPVSIDIDKRLSNRLKVNNRVRQFTLAAAAYLCDAGKLPQEFRESCASELSSLIDRI